MYSIDKHTYFKVLLYYKALVVRGRNSRRWRQRPGIRVRLIQSQCSFCDHKSAPLSSSSTFVCAVWIIGYSSAAPNHAPHDDDDEKKGSPHEKLMTPWDQTCSVLLHDNLIIIIILPTTGNNVILCRVFSISSRDPSSHLLNPPKDKRRGGFVACCRLLIFSTFTLIQEP